MITLRLSHKKNEKCGLKKICHNNVNIKNLKNALLNEEFINEVQ
jgi:hypothetical protein